MTTKEMAEIWGISEKTVANYCSKEQIPNAEKNRGVWNIPKRSIKPLNKDDIRRLLILSTRLHNNPELECDYSTFDFKEEDIRLVYESLFYRGYIHDISNIDTARIPYELTITEKGFQLIDESKKFTIM